MHTALPFETHIYLPHHVGGADVLPVMVAVPELFLRLRFGKAWGAGAWLDVCVSCVHTDGFRVCKFEGGGAIGIK
jgi:hypothetical protein